MLLGLVMDAIYQVAVFRTFYPFEAVIVAVVLAFLLYLILRGPIARAARHIFALPSAAAAGEKQLHERTARYRDIKFCQDCD
jgi:hypothetical protein